MPHKVEQVGQFFTETHNSNLQRITEVSEVSKNSGISSIPTYCEISTPALSIFKVNFKFSPTVLSYNYTMRFIGYDSI